MLTSYLHCWFFQFYINSANIGLKSLAVNCQTDLQFSLIPSTIVVNYKLSAVYTDGNNVVRELLFFFGWLLLLTLFSLYQQVSRLMWIVSLIFSLHQTLTVNCWVDFQLTSTPLSLAMNVCTLAPKWNTKIYATSNSQIKSQFTNWISAFKLNLGS